MLSNCTKNLLNLKDLIVKSVKNFENSVEIYAELPISEQVCPLFFLRKLDMNVKIVVNLLPSK